MPETRGSSMVALSQQLQTITVNAIVWAFLVSVLLLWIYQFLVLRGMRRSSSQHKEPLEPRPSVSSPIVLPPTVPLLISKTGSYPPGDDAGSAIASAARAGRRRVAAIYFCAGLVFAIVLAALYIIAPTREAGSIPLRFLHLTVAHAWPAVLAVGLAAALSWRDWALLIGSFAIVNSILLMPIFSAGTYPHGSPDEGALWANLMGSVLLLFLARRIRAVGPLMLVLMLAFWGGVIVAFNLVGFNALGDLATRMTSLDGIASTLALSNERTFRLVAWTGVATVLILAWIILRGIGKLYTAGWVSDQSILIDTLFLLFAVQSAIALGPAGLLWMLAPLLAFSAYLLVANIGFTVCFPPPCAGVPCRLLLLRVFSLGRRSQRLFSSFAKIWRHAGPIRMIAGPDLATTTVEPHEFLDFLSGRMSRQFISGGETIERRLAESVIERDRDGRWRIVDYFCHDDAWRAVLGCLASSNDVVLMDLRGFRNGNDGCVYEVNELIARVPIERVVLVIDKTTDEEFLRRVIEEGWARAPLDSPNRKAAGVNLRLFELKGRGDVPRLLKAVAEAGNL